MNSQKTLSRQWLRSADRGMINSYHKEAVVFAVALLWATIGFFIMRLGPINFILGILMVFLALELLGFEPKSKKRKAK